MEAKQEGKMKRYFDLSASEKNALDNSDLQDAVRLEAINRGIKPPITLDERINQGCYVGFTIPAERTVFYELCRPNRYDSADGTGVCFRTQAEAEAALKNAFSIDNDRYGNKDREIRNGAWTIQAIYLSSGGRSVQKVVTDYAQDDTEFLKLVEECESDLLAIRQSIYDSEVRKVKRAEYMRLANGDESIAKAFWSKTENTDWPASDAA